MKEREVHPYLNKHSIKKKGNKNQKDKHPQTWKKNRYGFPCRRCTTKNLQ